MVRFSLILSMCFIYILEALFPITPLGIIYNIVAIAVFLFMFPLLEWKGRMFTLTLFFAGVIIHFSVGDRGLDLFQGITQNMALLSILILAPLLSVPLKREGVIETIIVYLNEMKKNPRNTFYGISSFMLILAPILNMGALRIVHGFVESIRFPSEFLSRSYYIGFTPAVIWSPFFASVGIVLFYLDITYLSYVVVGVLFALLQMVVGFFLFRPKVINIQNVKQEKLSDSEDEIRKRYIYILIGYVTGLVLLLIVMEQILKKPMLLLVSIVCLIVPIVWAVLRKKGSIIKEEASLYKTKLLTQSKTELCLFLSAGLFGNAISHTPVKGILERATQWSATQSAGLLFLFILLFVTFMAALGVHQIIVIPLILTSLNFAEINISVICIAFMCIFTWMLSSSISPLNALNIIISQCVRKDGLTVAFKWNGQYFLVITGLAIAYVYLLNWI
jgi:hypothetical protein